MNRRDFLGIAGLAPMYVLAPSWAHAVETGPNWNRVLVLVELQGGNDGLNTVVPYADSRYYSLRPRLAIARDAVLPLSDELGLNPCARAAAAIVARQGAGVGAGRRLSRPEPLALSLDRNLGHRLRRR